MADEKYLERVRFLLNKAESTDSSEEAEALVAKATELMAKYSIDQALLDATRPVKDEPIIKKYTLRAPYARDKWTLMSRIGEALSCQVVRIQAGQHQVVQVFGYKTDIEHLEMLYTSLLLQQTNQVMHVIGYDAGHTKTLRKSWMIGFADAVGRRLIQVYAKVTEEAENTHAGTALVLADRKTIVEQMVGVHFPKMRKSTQTAQSGRAYRAGAEAGERADIGQQRVGRTTKALQ